MSVYKKSTVRFSIPNSEIQEVFLYFFNMNRNKTKINIPKSNLILALIGAIILFLLFLVNFLTFYLLGTEYNETRRIMTYIHVFGFTPMVFLILGFSISSIIISIICLFNRTYNYKNIIALSISLVTLTICIINIYLQLVHERGLVDIFF